MLLALFSYLSAIGTLFSSIFASWAVFVFRMSPNASASDQGIAPRGYVKTVFRSIFLNCPARAILENKLRSILNGINRSLTLTSTTFFKSFSSFFKSSWQADKFTFIPRILEHILTKVNNSVHSFNVCLDSWRSQFFMNIVIWLYCQVLS